MSHFHYWELFKVVRLSSHQYTGETATQECFIFNSSQRCHSFYHFKGPYQSIFDFSPLVQMLFKLDRVCTLVDLTLTIEKLGHVKVARYRKFTTLKRTSAFTCQKLLRERQRGEQEDVETKVITPGKTVPNKSAFPTQKLA